MAFCFFVWVYVFGFVIFLLIFWKTLHSFCVSLYLFIDLIFVADLQNAKIWMGSVATLNSTGLTEIPSLTLFRPVAIDVDAVNEMIYWTDDSRNTISRANIDGTNEEVLVDYLSGRNSRSSVCLFVYLFLFFGFFWFCFVFVFCLFVCFQQKNYRPTEKYFHIIMIQTHLLNTCKLVLFKPWLYLS